MRYTKPTILDRLNANHAIQNGHNPNNKAVMIQLDGVTAASRSTTGAYEADE